MSLGCCVSCHGKYRFKVVLSYQKVPNVYQNLLNLLTMKSHRKYLNIRRWQVGADLHYIGYIGVPSLLVAIKPSSIVENKA